MARTSRVALVALAVVGPLGGDAVRAGQPSNPAAAVLKEHIMLAPEDVQWGECSAALPPGAQCAVMEGDLKAADVLFGYRVRFPDGYRIAPHFHPADEHLVVVAGTFHMGMGDAFDPGRTRPMTPGSFMVMPRGTRHFAWTKGETIVHVYAIGPWGITYVNPADDPRNAPAPAPRD